MSKIINIKDVKNTDFSSVGLKATYLAKLSRSFNVPQGFILTTECFDEFIIDNQLKSKIRNIISVTDSDDEEKLRNASNTLQKLVLNSSLSTETLEAINEHYQTFLMPEDVPLKEIAKSDKEPIIVVRASPTENVESISLMHVQGTDKLHKSILAIYASLFNPNTVKKFSANWSPDMAVIIQKMIMPYISGYVKKQGDDIVLYACYGLWDEKMIFDKYIISDDMKLKSVIVENQKTAYMADKNTGNLSKIELNSEKSGSQKLSEKQILVLADLYRKTNFDKVEYIIDKDNYYFTQAGTESEPDSQNADIQDEGHRMDEQDVTGMSDVNNVYRENDLTKTENNLDNPAEDIIVNNNVDLREDNIVANKEMEEGTMPEEKDKKKENALFSIFNTGRGDKPVNIPKEPEREPSSRENVQSENSPHEASNDEVSVNSMNGNQTESYEKKEEVGMQTNTESVNEQTSNTESHTLFSEENKVHNKQAEVHSEIFRDSVPNEKDLFTTNSDDTLNTPSETIPSNADDAFIENRSEQPAKMQPETNDNLHPLKREEWVNTLRFEHTKLLLNYNAIILSKLKKRYTLLFDAKPESFSDMLKKISARSTIPCTEGIIKIHNLVNDFTKEHKLITIDQLKDAYMCTEKFIREF